MQSVIDSKTFCSAVGISYLLCIRCGTPWWQDHWWVVAMTVVAVMVLAEVAFVCHTLFFEQQILLQSGEQTSADVGVNTPLLFRPDDEGRQSRHARPRNCKASATPHVCK
ncbi:TPA: hypothetical protein ACH3X1_009388 [Trebouxia sp. C0004]